MDKRIGFVRLIDGTGTEVGNPIEVGLEMSDNRATLHSDARFPLSWPSDRTGPWTLALYTPLGRYVMPINIDRREDGSLRWQDVGTAVGDPLLHANRKSLKWDWFWRGTAVGVFAALVEFIVLRAF